jgi:hypothetical protein
MLALTEAFLLNNMWTLLLLAAFTFNIKQRQDNKPIMYANLILVCGFALPGIIYAQYIVQLTPLLPVFYLYWAGVNAAIVVVIYALLRLKGWPIYAGVKVVIVCLVIDFLFNLLLHVDRNIMALNGQALPNATKAGAWGLWVLRNAISNINNGVIVVCVLAPFKPKLKGGNSVFKQLLNVVDISRYKQGNAITQRVDTMHAMVEQTPNNTNAMGYLTAAQELIYRADETQKDFTNAIGLLLDAAAYEALQPCANDQQTPQATSA